MPPRGDRRWYGLFAALALLPAWCGAPAACAAEPAGEQVLVLHTGRMLKGKISRSPNGYVVEHSAGRLVVPFDETRVIGDSLPDAYRRLKESFVNPTAATHYELALWCSAHQLLEECRAELVMALDRDPDHEAARELLKRHDAERLAAKKRAEGAAAKAALPRIVNGIELPEVESLAGLSRETAAQFTMRIQPLLMNKCGNASCHGSNTKTSFQLEQTRGTGPGHRVHSERNLATVLKEIELSRPVESRLLQIGATPHGGMHRANFFGPAGEKQLKMLRSWVLVASKELSHDKRLAKEPNRITPKQPVFPKENGPVRTVSAEEAEEEDEELTPQASVANRRVVNAKGDLRSGEVARSGDRPQQARSGDRPQQQGKRPQPAADEEIVEEVEPDAFDPEAFNRRHHGTVSRKASSRKTPPRKTEP